MLWTTPGLYGKVQSLCKTGPTSINHFCCLVATFRSCLTLPRSASVWVQTSYNARFRDSPSRRQVCHRIFFTSLTCSAFIVLCGSCEPVWKWRESWTWKKIEIVNLNSDGFGNNILSGVCLRSGFHKNKFGSDLGSFQNAHKLPKISYNQTCQK